MQEFLAAVACAVGVALYIDLRVGQAIRKRNAVNAEHRRRVDEAHAAMLQAVWDVQDAAVLLVMDPPTSPITRREAAADWQANRKHRNAAAARYFAAVGE